MIHGYWETLPVTGASRPRLWVGVKVPVVSANWAVVPFLIDTGASATALGPTDATTHLGITMLALLDPTIWPRHATAGGIGGSCMDYLEAAEFAFMHDNATLTFLAGDIAIMQPTQPPAPSNAWVPSLLGRDLLQYFRLTIDWPGQTITLDYQPSAAPANQP